MDSQLILDLSKLITPFVFFLGACLGSFLNVCIYRIPRELSIVKPRSHCVSCDRLIPWYHNIPLLSWTLLLGKCRYCRAPFSPRYILVELLTALLFLAVWAQFLSPHLYPALAALWQPGADSAPLATQGGLFGMVPIFSPAMILVYWLALFGLILGTFVDIEHYILPNRVTIGGMFFGLILSPLVPELHGAHAALPALLRSLLGCAVGFGSLWLVATLGTIAFKKEAMGFGDVKLMGAVGAFLGWKAVLFSVIGSSFLGSVVGLSLIALGKRQLQGRIPYGPFIAAAAVIWMFWGPILLNLYLRFLLPS